MSELHEHGAKVEKNPLAFILASNGNASTNFSLLSLKTGRHFTYKVKKAPSRTGQPETWFVKYLFGPDNESCYKYMGFIRNGVFSVAKFSKDEFGNQKPSGLTVETPVVHAIMWTIQRLTAGLDTPNMEVWHAGRCGRCGRKLTVPESIQSGFGPECLSRMAA